MPGVGAMGCVCPGGLGDGGGEPGGLGDRLEHWGEAVPGGEPGEGGKGGGGIIALLNRVARLVPVLFSISLEKFIP